MFEDAKVVVLKSLQVVDDSDVVQVDDDNVVFQSVCTHTIEVVDNGFDGGVDLRRPYYCTTSDELIDKDELWLGLHIVHIGDSYVRRREEEEASLGFLYTTLPVFN